MSTTTTITAENVTSLFPEVNTTTRLIGTVDDNDNHAQSTFTSPTHPPTTNGTSSTHDDLSGYDPEQIRLMDETCIVLSPHDVPIGTASKKTCHLMTNINKGLLHRAFSCFLFHPTTHKLLLQQRASAKITFPDMWTNTCCSHPLAHASEAGDGKDLSSNVQGAKRAAVRKLGHELGIKSEDVLPIERFRFLTRIHYLAPSVGGNGDKDAGKWGEHEIDYILFVEADVGLDVNENEVRDTRWVGQEELKAMMREEEEITLNGHSTENGDSSTKTEAPEFTPWFRLICETMLYEWWDALEDGKLDKYENETQIRRMLPA